VEQIHELTSIDPWFLRQLREMVDLEKAGRGQYDSEARHAQQLLRPNATGSPIRARRAWNVDAAAVRARRKELGVTAVFNRVDTCAAEFESFTPYLYSSYESESKPTPSNRKKGHDPGQRPQSHRPGHRVRLLLLPCVLRAAGIRHESIMVNCNPETVSTDYDTSDRLYFEPLTLEEVLNICDVEKPDGVIVQFGGQTPLNLALPLKAAGRAHHRHRSRRISIWPKIASASASCWTI
jgi:carbamoyl-phosphate synthase large subunit